jgi:N utilization substance protein A
MSLREGDVATGEDDDVELTEFSDEIEKLRLKNLLKLVGYCKSILKQDVEEVRRTDLEEETILDVMRLKEFDS